MGTDIHGVIEFRHPGAGQDWYDDEPWVPALDLWPLYDERDYAAFGLLFGVRNAAGFRPLAEGRGLPGDASGEVRARLDGLESRSWVLWSELAATDPTTAPGHFVGRLGWSAPDKPWLSHRRLVPAVWPADVLAATGPPPELDALRATTWTGPDQRHYRYEPLTAGHLLGQDTHWPHVFAVMRALAGRYGDDRVRLVVGFG